MIKFSQRDNITEDKVSRLINNFKIKTLVREFYEETKGMKDNIKSYALDDITEQILGMDEQTAYKKFEKDEKALDNYFKRKEEIETRYKNEVTTITEKLFTQAVVNAFLSGTGLNGVAINIIKENLESL